MIAVDTNVLVRLITGDDAGQQDRARNLLASQTVWVATTVMLEANWVLRSVYSYDRRAAVAALRAIAGLPSLVLEDPARVGIALDWSEQGMDFADALHLAAAERCAAFVSFDGALVAMATHDGIGRTAREP